MAVKDEDVSNSFHPTQDLILSQPRRHLRAPVNVIHWQLRSLISTDRRDIVYFPAGRESRDIIRLNTATAETETVKRLQFQPKSLVAQNGWVCCGGEQGEFSAIQVEGGDNESEPGEPNLHHSMLLEVANRGDAPYSSSLARSRFVAKSKTFGKERVNCVTLWFPPTLVPAYSGAYEEPMAVLANNDKNVYVVSLRDQKSVDEVSHPDFVNRAVLSPDGRLLAAICDDPYLYVHERVQKYPGSRNSLLGRPVYEWRLCTKIFLKSQNLEDKSDSRGSFALCFSSTGTYLAVGTQYGTISVFNTNRLTEVGSDALITYFTSTRPRMDIGAVRDMAFAPGPVDLLAWTEDRGRVGVADVRRGFSSRQILYLEKAAEYQHLQVTDRSSMALRLTDSPNDRNDGDSLSHTFANSLDLSPVDAPRNPAELARELAASTQSPLSADETAILVSLAEHRRRREQRLAATAAAVNLETMRPPRSEATDTAALTGPGTSLIDLATSARAWADRTSRSLRDPSGTQTRDTTARERTSSVSRSVSDILGNIQEQRDRILNSQERLRASVQQNTQERLHSLGNDAEERLRASVGSWRDAEVRNQAFDQSEARLSALLRERGIAPRNTQRTSARLSPSRLQSSSHPETQQPTVAGTSTPEDTPTTTSLPRTAETPPRVSTLERTADRLHDVVLQRLELQANAARRLLAQQQARTRRDRSEVQAQTRPRRDRSEVQTEAQARPSRDAESPQPLNDDSRRPSILETVARRNVDRLTRADLGDWTSSREFGHDLENLYRMSVNGGPMYENLRSILEPEGWGVSATSTNAAAMATSTSARREPGAATREWEDGLARRVARASYLPRESRADPYDTAGLSWSEDGQVLYIGSENGIYEFHVNNYSRRFFPSITMR